MCWETMVATLAVPICDIEAGRLADGGVAQRLGHGRGGAEAASEHHRKGGTCEKRPDRTGSFHLIPHSLLLVAADHQQVVPPSMTSVAPVMKRDSVRREVDRERPEVFRLAGVAHRDDPTGPFSITAGFSRCQRWLGPVMKRPGQIALAVILCGAQSTATALVNWTRAALAVS